MGLTLFHDPGFAAPIGTHIMPIRKFALVAEQLRKRSDIRILPPEPVSENDLLRVHTPQYISSGGNRRAAAAGRVAEVSLVA